MRLPLAFRSPRRHQFQAPPIPTQARPAWPTASAFFSPSTISSCAPGSSAQPAGMLPTPGGRKYARLLPPTGASYLWPSSRGRSGLRRA
jgi:hypothetical protein